MTAANGHGNLRLSRSHTGGIKNCPRRGKEARNLIIQHITKHLPAKHCEFAFIARISAYGRICQASGFKAFVQANVNRIRCNFKDNGA